MYTRETCQTLIKLASLNAIKSREEASGRCFVCSLEFASKAQDIAALTLLRWEIGDDPEFLEHWAIRLSATQVLDVTRVQVDDETSVVKSIESYPKSYFLRGEYPASLLLNCCDPSFGSVAGMSLKTAVLMRWAIYRHDIARAPTWLRWKQVALGLVGLESFLVSSLVINFRYFLERRQVFLEKNQKTRNSSPK